jgi:predicted metal-binding membrane protein
MWMVMMAAMMLPTLTPTLWRYRKAIRGSGESHLDRLTMLVGAGYLLVWGALGAVLFPTGAALAAIEMQLPALARAVPVGAGAVVLFAGALQFSGWKLHHLACCREAPGRGRILRADRGLAWRHGLRLGLHCSFCCAGSTTILLVIGVMDLRAMAVVTAANILERFAPQGERVAQVLGTVAVAAGLLMIARAITHG